MHNSIEKKANFFHPLLFFLNKNRSFVFLFLVFWGWQLYQVFNPMWDQVVYSLQGKWFCGQSIYFEYLRPPFPGALNCLLGAGNFAPLFSAIIGCILFGYAVWQLGKGFASSNSERFIFFGLMFIFPLALFSSNGGWDVFALGLGLLAIVAQNSFRKGFIFGMATLTRYNYWLFLPAILLSTDRKKWPAFFIAALLTWVPWLWYNQLQSGDAFFSLKEAILLNVYQKGNYFGLDVLSILLIAFFILPFLFSPDKRKLLENPIHQFGILGLFMFIFSGNKEPRFLMPLIPSQAIFYSALADKNKLIKRIFLVGIVVGVLIMLIFPFYAQVVRPPEIHLPTNTELGPCAIASDRWIDFYPKGIVAGPTPPESGFVKFKQSGTTIVLFNKALYDRPLLNSLHAEEFPDYFLIKPIGCAARPTFYALKVPQ